MYEDTKCPFFQVIFSHINYFIVSVAGLLFFIGWWLVIDANAQHTAIFHACKIYHLPGILASIALICVNSVPTHMLYQSYYYTNGTCCTPYVARICLFIFFMASFGCLIAGFFILINDFMLKHWKEQWPGYAICLQNIFIFASNLLLRFGKKIEM